MTDNTIAVNQIRGYEKTSYCRGVALWIAFLALALSAAAQSLILPQIADGGNWRTAIVLVNTTSSAATASLTFFQDTTGGATKSWNPLFLETSNTQSLPVPAGGTLFLHTPGNCRLCNLHLREFRWPPGSRRHFTGGLGGNTDSRAF
jgi:hypothetical protein